MELTDHQQLKKHAIAKQGLSSPLTASNDLYIPLEIAEAFYKKYCVKAPGGLWFFNAYKYGE